MLEVLTLKERFYPRKKSLSAEDWTDLSGYLLEKLYGPLAPADEYLRSKIEDVKEMLERAVRALQEETDADKERRDYLKGLNLLLQEAIKDLQYDLGI